MDAALGLGLGHALDAMGPALELEHGVGAVAADLERVGPVGGAQRLGLEAAPVGVAGEHPVEVAGPQPGLLAARAAADLEDHVLVVGGVALDHREPDLLLQLGDPAPGGLEHLAQLRVLAVLGEQLLRARGVVLRAPPLLGEPRGDGELVELAAGLGEAMAVPDDLGVRHLRLHVGMARLDLLDQRFDHGAQSKTAQPGRGEAGGEATGRAGRPGSRSEGDAPRSRSYFWRLAARRLKRSTRPPVSTSF